VTRPQAGFVALLLGCALLLAWWSAGTTASTADTQIPGAARDPFGCGIVVTPATAVVGEDVVVSRPPTAAGTDCTTLVPGTTHSPL
jgi:hypothetical protein